MLYEFDHHHVNRSSHPDLDNATDEQLMAAVKKQDQGALAQLYSRHRPLLRTIVARVVNNDHDVDDLLQEIFLELWRMADHYDEKKGKALGWIVTLSRRRAIDRLRKKQSYARAEERLREETARTPESGTHNGVEEGVVASDTAEIMRKVLADLPEAQRDALHLAFYRGLSQREIAAKTGIPLGTIKTRIELGVRKVRARIISMGGMAEWSPAHAAWPAY
ncbi:MAG: sigma-70 family RNA polymerase sigma factor, partial [Chthoniobacteraceae bacterium]